MRKMECRKTNIEVAATGPYEDTRNSAEQALTLDAVVDLANANICDRLWLVGVLVGSGHFISCDRTFTNLSVHLALLNEAYPKVEAEAVKAFDFLNKFEACYRKP